MKTLAAGSALAVTRQYAAAAYLLQLDFTAPSAVTLYLSDHYVEIFGQEWLPYVADWGNLEAVLNTYDVGGPPATATLSLYNTKPILTKARLSDLIRTPLNTTGTVEWAFAKATVYHYFEGLTLTADRNALGVFYLEDPQEIGEDLLTIRMSDHSLVLENRLPMTRINRTEFPSCGKSRIGQTIPKAFGVLTTVPAIPVVDGAVSQLNGALTISATTIPLLDATDFPTSGTVQIDLEQISYTGKSGNSLTGGTRGLGTTNAAVHDDRRTVMQVKSGTNAYRYVVAESVAGYPIKSISNIKVNDFPNTVATTQLEATDIVTGKRFAAINFSVTDIVNFHKPPPPETLPVATNIPATVDQTIDSVGNNTWDFSIVATMQSIPYPYVLTGTVHRQVTVTFQNISGTFQVFGNNTISRVDPATGATVQLQLDNAGPDLNFAATATYDYDTATTVANEEYKLRLAGDADNFRFQWKVTVYTLSSATIQYLGTPSFTGDSTAAIAIGEVTCDLEGTKDNASGTISGTANLLLENPADITKFALLQLWPGIVAGDLGTSFATTRTSLASAGLKWAFLLEGESFSKMRRRLGEQARSVLYLTGGVWEYKFLPDAPAAQQTLDYPREVSITSPATVSRSARVDVKNSLRVSSAYDYTTRAFRALATVEDLTQPGLTDVFQGELTLDLVQDATTAAALGAFWLAQWKRQRFLIDLVAWWNILAVEPVDYLAFSNHPILEAHGGASLVFRVIGKSSLIADEHPGRIRLRLIEAGA